MSIDQHEEGFHGHVNLAVTFAQLTLFEIPWDLGDLWSYFQTFEFTPNQSKILLYAGPFIYTNECWPCCSGELHSWSKWSKKVPQSAVDLGGESEEDESGEGHF